MTRKPKQQTAANSSRLTKSGTSAPTLRLSTLPEIERKALLAQVIAQYLDGRSIREIASTIPCDHTTLYAALLADCPDEWKSVASAHALADLDNAEEELKGAADGLTIARARARTDLSRWKLERLLRRYFGQDSIQGPVVQVNIGQIERDKPAPITIEHTQVAD